MSAASQKSASQGSFGWIAQSGLGDLLVDKDELGPFFASPDADLFLVLRYLYSLKFRGKMPADTSDLFASLEHPSVATQQQARAISVFRSYRNGLVHGNISKLPPLHHVEEACAILKNWIETCAPVLDIAAQDSNAAQAHMIMCKFSRLLHETTRRTVLSKRDQVKASMMSELRSDAATASHLLATNSIGARSDSNENITAPSMSSSSSSSMSSALPASALSSAMRLNSDLVLAFLQQSTQQLYNHWDKVGLPADARVRSMQELSDSIQRAVTKHVQHAMMQQPTAARPSLAAAPQSVLHQLPTNPDFSPDKPSIIAQRATAAVPISSFVPDVRPPPSTAVQIPDLPVSEPKSSGFKSEGSLGDLRDQKGRDWLKGRRVVCLDGKHAHRTGVFHSWSGTVGYVVFDDTQEKIALSVQRRVGVFH